MEVYHILIIAAIISLAIEMLTLSFFLASTSVGFLFAAIANYLDFSTENQIYIFSFGVALTFFGIRPLFNIAYQKDAKRKTNQHAMIGKTAMVVEEINASSGLVKLDGDIWKAKTIDQDIIIGVNKKVEIVNLDSTVVIVRLLN